MLEAPKEKLESHTFMAEMKTIFAPLGKAVCDWVKTLPTVDLAWRVRQLRMARGLSQRQLADMAGITPSALSMIEHGKTKASGAYSLAAVALALGVSVDHLLGIDEIEGSAQDVTFYNDYLLQREDTRRKIRLIARVLMSEGEQ